MTFSRTLKKSLLYTSWRARRCQWNFFLFNKKISNFSLAKNNPRPLMSVHKKFQPNRSSRLAGCRQQVLISVCLFACMSDHRELINTLTNLPQILIRTLGRTTEIWSAWFWDLSWVRSTHMDVKFLDEIRVQWEDFSQLETLLCKSLLSRTYNRILNRDQSFGKFIC